MDEVLLHCRRANEDGRLSGGIYQELLDWFDRVCGELVTGFDQFGSRVWSWGDFFAGRVTRTRTEEVAGSRLTLTAVLHVRSQEVWVVALSQA